MKQFFTSVIVFWVSLPLFFIFDSAPETTLAAEKPVNIIGTRIVDLDGSIHRLGMQNGLKPVAIVFLDSGCPIANRYAPELNEFFEDAGKRGVEFYGMLSDPTLTLKEAKAYRKKAELRFPIVWDSNGDVAMRLKPTHFPECFVINKQDRLAYRGRIDNRFVSVGKLRANITSHELKDAVTAVAKGTLPKVSFQEPVGCEFEAWSEKLPNQLTFNRHVAPIIYANCTACHREGEVAPFPLENFEQTARRALMCAAVTADRIMPPWPAEPNFGHFRQERFLSDRQIEILNAWADGDQQEGHEDNRLSAPRFSESGWQLGKPDLVMKMPKPFSVPATGKDIYRYFVISNPLEDDLLITAMDFKPGDKTVVHHMNSFVDFAGRARMLDAKDEEPGFSVFGTGGFINYDGSGREQGYAMGGWVPGMGPMQLPDDHGIYIPAGGEIVIEIHYHLSGKATTDQSELAFYFAKRPVSKYLDGTVIGTQDLSIEPGDKNYRRHFWMKVPAAIDLVDILPHMHYIGTKAKVVATLPDGKEVPLVNITDWDFRWQSLYTFRQPVRLPAGSRIDAWFSFDNSADNPFNPLPKPEKVNWGWETGDEMAEVWMAYVPVDRKNSNAIYAAAMESWYRSGNPDDQELDIDATIKRLSNESLWSDEGEQLLLQIYSSGKVDEILKKIDGQLANQPRSAILRVAKGAIIGSQIWAEDNMQKIFTLYAAADAQFDAALAIDQYHWDAWMTKASFYGGAEDRRYEQQALKIFEQLIDGQENYQQKPWHAKAYIEYGKTAKETREAASRRTSLEARTKVLSR